MVAWGVFVLGSVFLAIAVVALARRSAHLLEDPSVLGLTRRALYLNLVVSQAVVLVATVGLLVLTGVAWDLVGFGPTDPLASVALAVALVGVNEGTERLGWPTESDNQLRKLLSPKSALEWGLLLTVLVPLVALSEELLFRGLLIGGVSEALGVAPLVMVLPAGVLFGLAHAAQGRAGVVTAACIGVALGVGFVVTDSLFTVVFAHYVVDVVEFLRHAERGALSQISPLR
ncbi:MAG: CPBP family intramembrane glutamic endopeptidase [Halodesulfurarchaeum sp.]